MPSWLIGVDTGGTFTDLIAVERESGALKRAKVPSVQSDPSLAVLNALERLFDDGVAPADVSLFVHGTTVATNALLESKGVRTGLLITRGFRGVYEARGWSQPAGSDLLDTFYRKPPLLVPQSLTEEVVERLDFEGKVITPLDEDALRRSVRRLRDLQVEAIAVCFLFSFINSEHERRAAEIIHEEAPDCRVSLSSEVLPVVREYPRLSTTVIDAYVGPKIGTYLLRLERRLIERGLTTPQLFLMQSNGGLMRISLGARHPNQTLLSGPAAGVIAGAELGRLAERDHVLTFDMGGTSTDSSVIVDGRLLETTQGQIAGQDIGTPMLRVRTVGAGGGTIAWLGKDGLIKVGPQSAGSLPGPACYGRGGVEPTVTDANVVLGYLGGTAKLAGSLELDREKAYAALSKLGGSLRLDAVQCASGVLRIVNTQMAVDLRLALQEQGQDPRRFTLVAFGGAGPLHAATLARAIGVPRVLIPLYPGLNCAMGMLQTEVRHSYLKSEMGVLARFPVARLRDIFSELEARALAEAREEGFSPEAVTLTRLLDLRYPHQGYTLAVPCPKQVDDAYKPALKRAFDDLHQTVYGQSAPNEDAEIVTFRVQSESSVPKLTYAPLAEGDGDAGRAVIERRRVYDFEATDFVEVNVYDRARLLAGDKIEGPALIHQFDSTTVLLNRQTLTVLPIGALEICEAS
ncbi:MAG: Methylhydantoinase [Hyphomicrobiales bacterium]|nr:Methylhydantoinase [Hyphomicrobiales bacterium]